jgi:predicted TIM-barrel fold metal-dependent hydrolase
MISTINPLSTEVEIFDAHHHLWDLSEGSYPWLQNEYHDGFFLGDYRQLCRDFMPEDYRLALGPYRVVGSVHIEAERARAEQLAETAFIASVQEQAGFPTVIVGHVYFDQPDCADILSMHAQCPAVRGIRSKPTVSERPGLSVRGAPRSMQDERWLSGLSLLERHDLCYDLRVPYWHLSEAASLARTFPRTRIVVNHLGLPLDRREAELAVWREGLTELADCPNVWLKVSELGLRGGIWDGVGNRRVVREAVDLFGFHRVMFGSNLPVSGLSADFPTIVQTIVDALPDASVTQLRQLFSLSARQFYRA